MAEMASISELYSQFNFYKSVLARYDELCRTIVLSGIFIHFKVEAKEGTNVDIIDELTAKKLLLIDFNEEGKFICKVLSTNVIFQMLLPLKYYKLSF